MSFPKLYSKRGKSPKTVRHDIPPNVRSRLLLLLNRLHEPSLPLLSEVGQRFAKRYGELTPCPYRDRLPAVHHFLVCKDEQALDFIEAIFTLARDTAGAIALVDEFNRVFREEGIGFELTPMTQRTFVGGGAVSPHTVESILGHGVHSIETTYPIIRKRGDTIQEESMKECLVLLADPTFQIANDQFLKAHQHYRANEWDQSIAYCGSAFESALKAVLEKKGVPFNKDASAGPLIQECVKATIFPQTYENGLIGIVNVRNAMSDTTHGRTPATQIVPGQKNAEHLLYVTAANIVFVSKCL
jgi:hypothetical protein